MTNVEITKIINDFVNSKERQNMIESENYYKSKNDIINRKFFYYKIHDRMEDTYRANKKIPNNYLSILVDQKVSYCLSNDVIVDNADLPFDINDEIDTIAEEAAIKSKGWNFIFINKFGEIKQKMIESENIIDIYDGTIENNLINIIRLYEIGNDKYCELWDDNYKYTYKVGKDTLYNLEKTETHLDNGISWGIIPFVPMYNNRLRINDLNNVKCLIDAYDLVISDFANNFIDFQEIVYFIKNYNENVSTPEAAAELMDWLKKYKVINVRGDGDLNILSQEVPYQARKEFLNILESNIYKVGKGVNTDKLAGSSLTTVAIKAHFELLNQKANKFLKEVTKYIKGMINIANAYNRIKNQAEIDINSIDITYNKAMIINESEIIENCVKSEGIIPRRLIALNHPWTKGKNIDELMKELDEEQLEYNETIPTLGVENIDNNGNEENI